ncbi:MAG: hypothetical protein JAY75_19335, partial [Candidatus Thiodiazotropha taylori]|nr:hypothetical protein [Candidatus Thiodiazotropha taylori]MCW4310375.1 hypothetical protein [Candidatus Thiodiazotropha endolucinida]
LPMLGLLSGLYLLDDGIYPYSLDLVCISSISPNHLCDEANSTIASRLNCALPIPAGYSMQFASWCI